MKRAFSPIPLREGVGGRGEPRPAIAWITPPPNPVPQGAGEKHHP
jgi:hypothetical protein